MLAEQQISDLCLAVYRDRLDDPDRQVRDDEDDGSKQRRRAECYRPHVLTVLAELGLHPRPIRIPPNKKGA